MGAAAFAPLLLLLPDGEKTEGDLLAKGGIGAAVLGANAGAGEDRGAPAFCCCCCCCCPKLLLLPKLL
jgi:hypothetical protein